MRVEARPNAIICTADGFTPYFLGYTMTMALKFKQLIQKKPRRSKKRSRRISRFTLWRFIGEFWCSFKRALLALPPTMRVIVISALIVSLWFGVNWSYHTLKKPSEILFPLDRSLNKHPIQTWQEYESLFREHATTIITPEFLAALAQVEAAGNPVARTYWRWQRSWNPLEWYRPASSAVGMFQITDGTFREATRYCIHDHVVVKDGPWNALNSCWFNTLYTRVVPSHAIELTSALLDRRVTELLDARRLKTTTLQQKQDLAAIIHLCGAGAGKAYTTRGLKLRPHQRCGDHDVRKYLSRIHSLQKKFTNPSATRKTIRQAH